MRQKLFLILGLIILIVILVGLNAVSYTQKEKQLDSEFTPNRSTYNTGATGTRAFFDLLTETGRKPVRWQSPPAELLLDGKNKPATFVIIGQTRKQITDEDAAQILRWVSEGGKLVLIDREPPSNLVKTTANWNVIVRQDTAPDFLTDASDQKQMTAGTKAARAVQPTIYTKSVNGVQHSRFAASVFFEHLSNEEIEKKADRPVVKATPYPTFSKTPPKTLATPTPKPAEESGGIGSGRGSGSGEGSGVNDEPVIRVKSPTPVLKSEPADDSYEEDYESPALSAPVAHLAADTKNLLVDVPYGEGRIIFLSEPYIVANGGVNLVDNAQLAINVVASQGGVIAFDEYHQGYGSDTNQFFQFFAGTPVIPVFIQIALLVGVIFYSQSRRFARPVPETEPSRLSKLEYVAAMAELQQRTRGYDLAIENIYTDFRRRVSRLVGVDALKTRRQDLALLICERLPDENPNDLEALMKRCEDVMHGDATGKKEVLHLTTRLREIENKLGLQRRKKSKK